MQMDWCTLRTHSGCSITSFRLISLRIESLDYIGRITVNLDEQSAFLPLRRPRIYTAFVE